jgi:hypothetical protein
MSLIIVLSFQILFNLHFHSLNTRPLFLFVHICLLSSMHMCPYHSIISFATCLLLPLAPNLFQCSHS